MICYADSSAVVKLYASEQGSEIVEQLDTLVVSALARVEVPAALWRKQRLGEIGVGQARTLVASFEADYYGTETDEPRFLAVSVSGEVLEEGARLCSVHGLRAYDAFQLASGLLTRAAEPDCDAFAAFDLDLRRAVALEGFEVVPAHLV